MQKIVPCVWFDGVAEDAAGRDLDEAIAYASEAARHARRVGDHALVSFASAALADAQLIRGHWDQIDDATLRAQVASLHGQALHTHLTVLAALAVWRGEEPDLDAWPGDGLSAEDTFLREEQISLRALLAVAKDDREAARELSVEYAEVLRSNGVLAINKGLPTLVAYGLDVGELDAVRQLLRVLWDVPPGLVPPLTSGQLRWFEARLAAIEDDDERASRLFEEARDVLGELGAGWWLARVQLDDAVWAQGRGRHRRAEQLATQARDRFAELGAGPFLTRAEHVLDARRWPTHPDARPGAAAGSPTVPARP
jgi:hypothetical protein